MKVNKYSYNYILYRFPKLTLIFFTISILTKNFKLYTRQYSIII